MAKRRLPRLCGVKEVALLLDISKGSMPNKRKAKDFPEPVQILASGPIWIEEDILKYKEQKKNKGLIRERG